MFVYILQLKHFRRLYVFLPIIYTVEITLIFVIITENTAIVINFSLHVFES